MGRTSAKIMAFIFFGPVFIAPLMIKALPFLFNNSLYLAIIGLAIGALLILAPKIMTMKREKLFTFGPGNMSEPLRKMYYIGYGIFITSAILGVSIARPAGTGKQAQGEICGPSK